MAESRAQRPEFGMLSAAKRLQVVWGKPLPGRTATSRGIPGISPAQNIGWLPGNIALGVLAFLLVLLALGAATFVASLALLSTAGADEAAAIRSELREAGYVVHAVAPQAARNFPGNRGESVAVPAGARLYRITFRSALGTQYRDAYRLVAGPFGDRWSFPEGR